MLRSLVFEATLLPSVSHLIKRCVSVTVAARLTEKKAKDEKTKLNPAAAAELSNVGGDQSSSKRAIRLHASVCIERMPVITCEMNDLEKRYSNLINQINVRKSLLSNHELRHKRDLEEAAKRAKEGNQQTQTDLAIETAIDFEDKAQKELEMFKFGQRITASAASQELEEMSMDYKASDKGGKKKAAPLQNIERVLDKKLILLVHDAKTSNWELPKIEWTPTTDPTLRHAAERAVSGLNDKLRVQFLGNAPVGIYKHRTDNFLDKHYFFKCQYISGAEFLAASKYDFIWIRKEELKNFVKNQNYLNCLEDFILDF